MVSFVTMRVVKHWNGAVQRVLVNLFIIGDIKTQLDKVLSNPLELTFH